MKKINSLNYLSDKNEISLDHNIGAFIEWLRILLGFVDSDHGRDPDIRRAITVFIFFLVSYILIWQSKSQASVALSSMEAEYMAACAASRETIWLSKILQEFGSLFTKPIILLEDNQACIHLSKNLGDFTKSKHIDTRYHFVRKQVEKGTIILNKVDTKDNLVDIFTKPLPNAQFNAITSMTLRQESLYLLVSKTARSSNVKTPHDKLTAALYRKRDFTLTKHSKLERRITNIENILGTATTHP